jgi:hypothetical protein
VHAEQAGRVSSRLSSPGDHPNNFSLLLMIQLWRSPANAPLPEHEAHIVDDSPFRASKICRLTEFPAVCHTDVRPNLRLIS